MSYADRLPARIPATAVRAPLAPGALADISAGLARSAAVWSSRLLTHPTQRTGLRLLATADYDAWLLHWPSHTSVTPHDHGESIGAFTVVSGELTEVRWHGSLRLTRLVAPGEVVTIEQRVVHDVIAGEGAALSVHAYSPPLTAMGFYAGGVELVDVQPVEAGEWPPLASRLMHPARGD